MRIEVVGGGIAGLAVAAGLQRKGAEVRVRERQSDATQVGSGLSLFGNGFAALRALGPEMVSVRQDLRHTRRGSGCRRVDGSRDSASGRSSS